MKLQTTLLFLLFFNALMIPSFAQNTQKDSILTVIELQAEHNFAELYLSICKLEEQTDSIRKYALLSLKFAKENDQLEKKADAYKSLGASYHLASSYDNAMIYYDSALMFFSSENQSNALARTHSNKAGIFIRFRSLDSAIYHNEKCFYFAQFTKDEDLNRIYLKRKANIYSLQGKHQESILELKKMLNRNDLQKVSQIITVKDIGVNYFNLGMIDSALFYYDKADKMGIDDLPENKIVLLNNQANAYIFIGDHEESIKCYLQAIQIADSINYEYGLTLIKSNLANLYFEWDKLTEAIKIYKESLAYLKEHGIYRNLATNYINIGISYNSLNQIDSSLKYMQMAKDVCLEKDDQSLLSTVYHNLGRTYFAKEEYQNALDYYKKALIANKRDNNINTRANIYHDMALSLVELKDYKNSIYLIDSANNIYNKIENSQQVVDVVLSKALILKKMGKHQSSNDQLLEFIHLKDSVFSKEKFKQISDLETKYKTAEKEAEIQKHLAHLAENELEINQQKNKALTYGILFAGAAIILLIISIILLRIRQKHLLIKSELEQHSKELEGRLLRSQMNPHFIFNSLNSIQSYITSNDQYYAEIYLSKFAKLMRSILENSRHSFVSIEQDIANLSLYLELESLRFENKFIYKLEIDDHIDLENTYIPPMLIQPYIENSIIHGLVHKKDGEGLLTVEFKELNDNNIKCIITDNGIGREKALEIKHRNAKPYQSLGMKVTKERMQVIASISHLKFEENIIDLKDKNGHSLGTKIELLIPIEKD